MTVNIKVNGHKHCHSVQLLTPVITKIFAGILLRFYIFSIFFNVKMDQPKKTTYCFPSKKLSVKKSLNSRVMNHECSRNSCQN